MTLTDATIKVAASTPRRAIGAKNKRWGDSQKIEFITTYLATGNLNLTAALLKVPEITARKWKATQWWKETEESLRLQEKLVVSDRIKKIIDKALTTVEDRLTNGDFIFDSKSGGLVRKPVNMKDAHKVTMDLMERRDVLINDTITNPQQTVAEDKLKTLAAEFIRIAQQQVKPAVVVTDVIEGKFNEVTL